jgi:hypothetical protein
VSDFIAFDIYRTVSQEQITVYPFRIFPVVFIFLALAVAGCGGSTTEAVASERLVAANAQLDAVSGDVEAFVNDLTSLADRFGGEVAGRDGIGVELRIPAARWGEAFEELRARPEAAGGEQVWGQDITEEVNEILRELEDATGDEAAFLRAKLAFRVDRIERAVIVVRIRPPG